MKLITSRTCAVMACLAFLPSCSSTMGDFSVLSTRNVSGITDAYQNLGKCEEKDGAIMLFVLPLGRPSLKDAIEKCITKYPGGEFLMNARASSYSWSVFLTGGFGYKVKGDVYGRKP